jgi:hydroxymethylpyrimidine/phosphomethylpyrimidine kinase
VCASKHGDPLLAEEAVDALRDDILPLAEIVTPNLGEVRILTGVDVTDPGGMREAAEAVKALGPRWVLVKGGHLPAHTEAVDLLYDGERAIEVRAERLDTTDTHGTGCTLAAAVAAQRALGLGVVESVTAAKEYVTGAIRHGLRLGRGIGPLDHAWRRR